MITFSANSFFQLSHNKVHCTDSHGRSKRKISKKRKKRRYTLPEWKLEPKDD